MEVAPSAPSTTDVTQTVEAVAATTVDVFSIAWRAGLGTLVGIALAFVGVVVLRALGLPRPRGGGDDAHPGAEGAGGLPQADG